jgi:hypothetical protein
MRSDIIKKDPEETLTLAEISIRSSVVWKAALDNNGSLIDHNQGMLVSTVTSSALSALALQI